MDMDQHKQNWSPFVCVIGTKGQFLILNFYSYDFIDREVQST